MVSVRYSCWPVMKSLEVSDVTSKIQQKLERNGVDRGCLIFGAVAALRAYAETVLVVYSGGNKEVRQFSVANGVWTYEGVRFWFVRGKAMPLRA